MFSKHRVAVHPALIALATLMLSACSTIMPASSSIPSETPGGQPMAMSMKSGMTCADMKDGCPCCGGMSGGKAMMCHAKDKAGSMSEMDHSTMDHGQSGHPQ